MHHPSCYPPGVLQTAIIPDPTSLDGFGDLEITFIPSRDYLSASEEAFSDEGIQHIKEMLYEADEEYRRGLQLEMNSTITLLEAIRIRDEGIFQDNAIAIGAAHQPSLWFEMDCEYGLPAPWNIRDALDQAEEDADYEEWINSKEYQQTLKEYNMHKLLAWDKGSDKEHPKWSGEYNKGFQRVEHMQIAARTAYVKERYRVEVDVAVFLTDNNYAKGSSPYGDVYIPRKIASYLKNGEGLYEMDIALQDVEGALGKKPNSFRWTCVYLRNKGFSLE